MNNELSTHSVVTDLALPPEYNRMVSIIKESEIAISKATAQHQKSHSQLQYAALDCSGPLGGFTKLRNWRQVLAVIDRTRSAIEDSYLASEELKVQIEICQNKIDKETDPYRLKLLNIRLQKQQCHLARISANIAGAIRKLTTYTEQFKELERQIRQELGKSDNEPITEKDFEQDEERFHIMKAFQQALQAARAFNGAIDHGNMIYFDDIGINGSLAQEEVYNYLREIEPTIKQRLGSQVSVHDLYKCEVNFLRNMAKKFAGCTTELIKEKGMIPGIIENAILT